MSTEKENEAAAISPPQQPKYSRYRSVRHTPKPVEPEPAPISVPVPDVSRTKSMSRYRRSRVVSNKTEPIISSARSPPVPSLPAGLGSGNGRGDGVRRVTDPGREAQAPQRRETDEEKARRMVRELQEREARARRELRELEAQKRIAMQKEKEAEAEMVSIAEEMLAEQKRKDLERLQAELDAASPVMSAGSSTHTPKKEKFGAFFGRRKSPPARSPPRSVGSGNGSAGASLSPSRSNQPSRSVGIEQGGGGIVPQIDAPISASNAGERRILIRCKQSSINLPITPETTPQDIIYSAANIMTQNIIPSTAVLLESYTQLGLERRIRRYEHIRDIMNSWDRDTQNALILTNSDTPLFDTDLEASSIEKVAPPDVTVYMYHSQKPGKWTKCYITLMSTGQMHVSKKSGQKLNSKYVSSICHLSDFDIYNPTPQQLRKTLKPPKKKCFAIKSQQKTTIFLSTENFVHFFCTDDEALAEKFYAAVQKWRSWYLVNRMGEGKKARVKTHTDITELRPGTSHRVKVSVEESPYTIGSFQQLLNMDRFGATTEEEDDEDELRQIPFHLRNSMSFPSRRDSKRLSQRHPPPVLYRLHSDPEEEFASSGLLGRTYSQRQKEQKAREQPDPLPSLLHTRTNSITRPTTAGGPGLQRSDSRSKPQLPKPLLDFTPTFKEAPQWDKSKSGRGVKVEGGLLVEAANTPSTGTDDIPKAAVFRRPETSAGRPKTVVNLDRVEGPFVRGGLVSGGR